MNPDHGKTDELFHLALECEAGARQLSWPKLSDGDDDLRRELEAMLAHHEQANSFN